MPPARRSRAKKAATPKASPPRKQARRRSSRNSVDSDAADAMEATPTAAAKKATTTTETVEEAEEDPIDNNLYDLVFSSLKRSRDMFASAHDQKVPDDERALRIRLGARIAGEYGAVQSMESAKAVKKPKGDDGVTSKVEQLLEAGTGPKTTTTTTTAGGKDGQNETGLVLYQGNKGQNDKTRGPSRALVQAQVARSVKQPDWHAPWKLFRVIAGHTGWVRSIAVDPANEWFATGAGDRTIKIWDLASGTCKLTLTGHISTVRALCVSPRQPYLFSVGEDKMVKCWDLEYNKVIRHYHGHLSAVHCMSMHPALDILMTGGRDSTCRVWDIRTRAQVHILSGHTNTVSTVRSQAAEPQVITGSHDSQVRLWDLAAGKCRVTLTNHKRSVRASVIHPTEYTFASGATGMIKKWKCPDGKFMSNIEGPSRDAIINTMSVNADNVLFAGGDNGEMCFYDWKTGYCFQRFQAQVQPGSLESEAGVFASSFDITGSRFITGQADKTIKVYKEDTTATPETHPINYKPQVNPKRR